MSAPETRHVLGEPCSQVPLQDKAHVADVRWTDSLICVALPDRYAVIDASSAVELCAVAVQRAVMHTDHASHRAGLCSRSASVCHELQLFLSPCRWTLPGLMNFRSKPSQPISLQVNGDIDQIPPTGKSAIAKSLGSRRVVGGTAENGIAAWTRATHLTFMLTRWQPRKRGQKAAATANRRRTPLSCCIGDRRP